MRKLIVNADDFGLAADVTDGIVDAYRKGIVSSTSLMVGGTDVMRAAMLAQQETGMAVGIHLTLVDGKSAEPITLAPSLLGDDGKFLDDYRQFIRRYFMGGVKLSEVRAEFTAQIHRFLDLGLQPSHLDSHQHLHLLPGIFEIVLELAVKFHIKRLRITRAGWLDRWRSGVGGAVMHALSRRGQRIIRGHTNGLLHCDHFLGARYSCRLNKHVLLDLIDQVGEGSSELMCHPGRYNHELLRDHPWGRNWQIELDALTDPEVKERVRQRKIEIVSRMSI